MRLATLLRPGGRMLVVDDVPNETLAPGDPDFVAFRAGWMTPAIASDAALAAALARAGLEVCHDLDLTPRLTSRNPAALAALAGLSGLAERISRRTPAGVLLGALHGGLRLERLYRRRQMRYRLVVARRP